MELNKQEKMYLQQVLKRELNIFKKDKQVFIGEGGIVFFQVEEEYEQFLEKLLSEIQKNLNFTILISTIYQNKFQ